jgi:hypothetical protein
MFTTQIGYTSLIYLERPVTVFQEIHNLACRSNACIDICFFGLSTHLLGRKEITSLEISFKFSFVGGFYIRQISKIFPVCEKSSADLLPGSPQPWPCITSTAGAGILDNNA